MGKPSSWWAGGTRAVGELFYSLLPTPTPGLNTHIPGLPYVHFYMEFLGYWVLHPKKRMVGYICQRGPAPLLPSTPRSQHQQLNSQKPDLLQWVREQSTHIPKRKKKKTDPNPQVDWCSEFWPVPPQPRPQNQGKTKGRTDQPLRVQPCLAGPPWNESPLLYFLKFSTLRTQMLNPDELSL